MNTLPRKMTQLEIWWWELPDFARWLLGSVTVAMLVGVLGGILA